jgi:sortase (surface protein transpeptidase)
VRKRRPLLWGTLLVVSLAVAATAFSAAGPKGGVQVLSKETPAVATLVAKDSKIAISSRPVVLVAARPTPTKVTAGTPGTAKVALSSVRVAAVPPAAVSRPTSGTAHHTSTRPTSSPKAPGVVPEVLRVPALGITIKVGRLGLQSNGEIEVPTTTHQVGWYTGGPTPGQIGSAAILGHVDSYAGIGVFFYLKNLQSGDKLSVTLSNQEVAHFTVTKVVQYPKNSFPDALVYGNHGVSQLQLVTCGGVFNRSTGHYESNIVVYSRLTSVTTP